MLKKEKIEEIVKNTLLADAYSLGSHWVYDEKQLSNLDIDWQELNAPKAMWHKGKSAGDYTHIGDQAYWLYEFLQEKDKFEPLVYLSFWKEKMDSYTGYIDGATRETLENIKNSKMIGSDSHDFSVIGRITPLLLVSKNEEDFRKNVQKFVKLSHNNMAVLEVADFFARLLFEIFQNKNIEESILNISKDYSDFISNSVLNAIKAEDKNSFEVIRDFGPACDIDGGFPGIIYLVLKYRNNPKELLIQNAKAGGDSSSRAMPAILMLCAYLDDLKLPLSWKEKIKF